MNSIITRKYQSIREYDSLIRFLVLHGIGIGVNIIYITLVPGLPRTADQQLTSTAVLFLASYFFIGIVYSITATLSFSPKRIVSQLYIQISTAIIIIIFMSFFYYYLELAPSLGEVEKKEATGVLVLIPFILGITGFIQTEIIKKVVGLNGNENELDIQTYEINAKFHEIENLLKEKSYRNLVDFHIDRKSNGILVLESRLRPITEKIIFVLSTNDQENSKSIMATVAYDFKYHSIKKSENASRRRNSLISELKQNLKDIDSSYDCVLTQSMTDASLEAKRIALKPTIPKIFAIRYIPRYILLAIFGTIALFGILTYGRFFGEFVNDDVYYTSIVLIILATLFEFLPLLRNAKTDKNSKTE